MTAVAGLLAFLEACIAADEQVARAASGGPWHWVDPGDRVKLALVSGNWESGAGWGRVLNVAGEDLSTADAEHIARWDPARVLAECAAKQKLMKRITEDVTGLEAQVENEYALSTDPPFDRDSELMLREMATVYAGRPGYLEEWRTVT